MILRSIVLDMSASIPLEQYNIKVSGAMPRAAPPFPLMVVVAKAIGKIQTKGCRLVGQLTDIIIT